METFYTPRKTKSGCLVCIVPMCQTKKSTTTLKTFEFPSDLKRRTQWISAIVDATVKNEEEETILEDLYTIENRRVELEMEISSILGDHSYVCARHFLPEDIIVHPNVCRLTTNAVPSVFKNYPVELPRQFFKKICQTAQSIVTPDFMELDSICEQSDLEDSPNKYIQEVTVYDPAKTEIVNVFDSLETYDEENNESCRVVSELLQSRYVMSRGTNTKIKYTGIANPQLAKNQFQKRFKLLQTKCKGLKDRLDELENKFKLYNIAVLERDAVNNNEEAKFLLEMLRSYTVFEKTRKEILSCNEKN